MDGSCLVAWLSIWISVGTFFLRYCSLSYSTLAWLIEVLIIFLLSKRLPWPLKLMTCLRKDFSPNLIGCYLRPALKGDCLLWVDTVFMPTGTDVSLGVKVDVMRYK